MNYFKVLSGQSVIDAGCVFLRWQRKHNILLGCPAHEAHYIQSSDRQKVWRARWLNPLPPGAPVHETVDAVEITEEEYLTLRAQLDEGLTPAELVPEKVLPEPEEPATEEPQETVMSAAEMRRRIASLEERNAFLEACILEMSEVMFA